MPPRRCNALAIAPGDITGAATVTTTFTQLNAAVGGGDVSAQGVQQTCAKAAAVGDANSGIGASGDTWQVPSKISDISAPENVNVTVASNQWKGPGSYGASACSAHSGCGSATPPTTT